MRLFFLAATAAALWSQPVAAQRTKASPSQPTKANKAENRLALSSRAEAEPTSRPLRMACAPIIGKVFDPEGQPLVGATLLVKGTHQVYVTDSEGKFTFSDPVYEGQVLAIGAAGYTTRDVLLADCNLPRLVLARAPTAHIKRSGKRAGQVTRFHRRTTNMR